MLEPNAKRHRVGEPIPDLCRACKAERGHTVMATDPDGHVLRVVCDFCGSQHNYRSKDPSDTKARAGTAMAPQEQEPFAPAGERERTGAPLTMTTTADDTDLELMFRRVLREELGLSLVVPAEKWRGGEMLLRPGKPGLQEKSWPIETFFHKIVMIRNRLRTLEQQVNGTELPADTKLRLQSYITGCYGSLTSFNILFADEADQFRGSASGE